MPELPEVETIRRGLDRLIVGKTIARARHCDSPKSFPNDPTAVAHFLHNARVTAVRRRAKVLLIELNTCYTLVVHLKMTGQLVFVGAERWGGGHPTDSLIHELPDRHTRVIIDFTDGTRLFFNDLRKFGWMKLYPTAEVPNMPFMRRVGPEPLGDSCDSAAFISRIRRRNNTTVKAAILDQSVIAGVGNIYADESLWQACIHPAMRVHALSGEQLAVLLTSIKQVLALGIETGGSTDKNYVDAEGNKGNYLQFAHVFRREGQPCQRHPDSTIQKIRVAGRGTHVCPVCQVLPLE
ncbi:bifunctional DNA-formamidopyrimidine glycosylase/DNA-(apurinic or apyrimidinic site) lyase [Candidatus Southlakia epibionticum]|uniref:Bifunctional DNA-formamidopyrimidine glycosylase/DNA-(Apurinic or apyrimidinic site) lyase n=1 Tax=Candidatus Southlakia epibionticum TaxID=3043284 RepID=A0ABY8WV05_9BACT|nr:bifunctional DNA-formamidopyrimidine glycosylase/DNA-(apurinic or apyrimidinic site) lyase [Candidatus Saccharimonadaceae bacterium ML1]